MYVLLDTNTCHPSMFNILTTYKKTFFSEHKLPIFSHFTPRGISPNIAGIFYSFFSVFLFWLQPSFIVEASVHMAQEIVKLISGQDPVLQAMRETALNTIKQSGALISARLVYYKNMALFPDRKCQGCKDGEMLVRSRNCEVDTF